MYSISKLTHVFSSCFNSVMPDIIEQRQQQMLKLNNSKNAKDSSINGQSDLMSNSNNITGAINNTGPAGQQPPTSNLVPSTNLPTNGTPMVVSSGTASQMTTSSTSVVSQPLASGPVSVSGATSNAPSTGPPGQAPTGAIAVSVGHEPMQITASTPATSIQSVPVSLLEILLKF